MPLTTPPVPAQAVPQSVVAPQHPVSQISAPLISTQQMSASQISAQKISASQISTSQMPASPVAPQYSASIPTSSVPVSLSVQDMPAPSHPTSAPQSTCQTTTTSSDHDTTDRDTSSYSQFAPPPDDDEDNAMGEFKAEAIPEIVMIKDEPMSSNDSSALLPQETLHHLMNTLQSNEENIGVSNLVTTAQPSSLPSTFLDKTNNPLSMLTLSNTTANINNLFPGSDNMPGSSRGGDL